MPDLVASRSRSRRIVIGFYGAKPGAKDPAKMGFWRANGFTAETVTNEASRL
jgi:hypothetical protein